MSRITAKEWWVDKEYLKSLGMQSDYDHMTDATRFAYQNYRAVYSNDQLKFNRLTPDDVLQNFENARKSLDDYAHPGPTNAELRHPAVRNAWEEFEIIRRLAGSGYENR